MFLVQCLYIFGWRARARLQWPHVPKIGVDLGEFRITKSGSGHEGWSTYCYSTSSWSFFLVLWAASAYICIEERGIGIKLLSKIWKPFYLSIRSGGIFLYIIIQKPHGLFPGQKSSLICSKYRGNKARGICSMVLPKCGAFCVLGVWGAHIPPYWFRHHTDYSFSRNLCLYI